MLKRIFRNLEEAHAVIVEQQNAAKRLREMQLVSLAVQWGRVHYHVEKMRYPSLYATPADCLLRGQREAIYLWNTNEGLHSLECVAFIGAFMDGWKQGMDEW